MGSLNSRERRKLEELFGMSGGFVLDFSNREFEEFFSEFVGANIYDNKYADDGESKARRLRCFWRKEPDWLVQTSIEQLIAHGFDRNIEAFLHPEPIGEVRKVQERLAQSASPADIQAIGGDGADFEAVAKAVRDSINRNEPEQALDRLHTFLVKFVRKLCSEHGLDLDRTVPLNGLFGAYVKKIRAENLLTSTMAEHILKASITIFGQFDHVRNNHSLAHDNALLSYDEALLIVSHVSATVRFVKAIEDQWRSVAAKASTPGVENDVDDWDVPF